MYVMTPRERVLAALNHREPDRVPIDFGGHRSSGIAAMAYAKLREALGLPQRPVRVYDPIQQLAIVDDDVLDRFDVDTIELGRGFALDDQDWADWILPDGTPCQMPVWALPERADGQWVLAVGERAGDRADARRRAVLRAVLLAVPGAGRPGPAAARPWPRRMWVAMRSPPGPLAMGPTATACWPKGPGGCAQQTDRAIIGLFGGNLLEIGQFLYRNDNFLMLLAGDPRAGPRLPRSARRRSTWPTSERFLAAVGAVHRHHPLRRRPGHAERPANVAGDVPRVLQAPPRRDVAAGQGTGRREGHAPLLRRRAAAAGRPDRGRPGRHQPGADLLHAAWTRPA